MKESATNAIELRSDLTVPSELTVPSVLSAAQDGVVVHAAREIARSAP